MFNRLKVGNNVGPVFPLVIFRTIKEGILFSKFKSPDGLRTSIFRPWNLLTVPQQGTRNTYSLLMH